LKDLKKFLQTEVVDKNLKEQLAVGDSKLGGIIKEKLGIACVADNSVNELLRGIRTQLNNLITGLPENEMKAMVLGLSHSLSRYKLKFSPDKVDVMIIQAICKQNNIFFLVHFFFFALFFSLLIVFSFLY
jgi:nucleolar protein 58